MSERRAYERIDPRKARAWSATLKPNSILRHEAPGRVGVLRALMLLMKHGRSVLTYGEIAALSGFSWRTVQDAITWARAGRLIWSSKMGGGLGMRYVLMPALAENFLGNAPRQKRGRDAHSNSQHRRGIKNPSVKRKSAAPEEARPNPPAPFPDNAGKGGAVGSEPGTQSGRGRVPSVGPGDKPAPSATSSPRAPGRKQRSKEEIEQFERALAEFRAFQAEPRPPDPGRTARPGARRRVIQHPEKLE